MERSEEKIIKNYEIFFIFVLFLFIMYIIFPEKSIIKYSLNERTNLNLAEMYLENISNKYPERNDISVALLQLYIKEKKYFKARELIEKLKRNNLNNDLINFYYLKIKLLTLTPKNYNKEIKEIYSFFINILKRDNEMKNQIDIITEIFNFTEKLYELKKEKDAVKFTLSFFYNSSDKSTKKQILLKYIEMLRKHNLMPVYVKTLKQFEEFSLDDDRLSYEIMKSYIQSNKIFMASNFSLKIMKRKKIL